MPREPRVYDVRAEARTERLRWLLTAALAALMIVFLSIGLFK